MIEDEFRAEFPLRLQVLANGSQGTRYTRAATRRAENEVAWWELRKAKLHLWAKANRGPYQVTLWRLAPGELDTGNLWYALKGVQDVVAELLGLKTDRDGHGARWEMLQLQTPWVTRPGRPRTGDYRVRVVARTEGKKDAATGPATGEGTGVHK